ncbi:hypothetical protein [Brevundimonas sp.]|uniref:hypothetical protein n=1 Tax=Brevundimonas sp. TaxID=1871086 RepID=UPI002FC82281
MLHNELASSLFVFFHHYLHVPNSIRSLLFDTLNNKGRVDLLRRLAEDSAPDDVEAMAYALKCFNICTENRNIIAHSRYLGLLNDGRHSFRKEPTAVTPTTWDFALTAEELSKTARDIETLYWHSIFLWGSIRSRGEADERPLPERPPQPRKLSLFRLEEDPVAD